MRKLMWFAVGFGGATAVGIYCLGSGSYLLAAGICALMLLAAIFLRQRYRKLRIAVAVLLGMAVSFTALTVFGQVYLSVPRAADEQSVTMTLTATDYSQETDYGISVEAVGKLNGKYYAVKVYLSDEEEISPGHKITGQFTLRCSLPGCSRESSYNASDGIFLIASSGKNVQIAAAERLPWYGFAAYARERVKEVLSASLPEDVSAFGIALMIGDKQELDYETDTAFKISGISHIIAVSGLHVTILFSLVYFLVGRKRLLAFCIGLPVLFLFAAVAGFSPSITRACIMHGLMVAAMLFDKDYDPPTALGFAVVVMLAVNPWIVASVSFQLSVGCMCGILLFAQPIANWILDKKCLGRWKGRRGKTAKAFALSVGMSLGATVFVTPLCAYYFGTVSLVGALTNLLTLWMVTFVFYGVLAVLTLGLIWLPGAKVLGWCVAWLIRYILTVAGLLSKFPLAAVYTDSIYIVLWLIFVYLLLAIHLILKKKQIVIMSCCAVMGLCLALILSWTEVSWNECQVTVVDVGQGQCILLQSEGRTFVVDCGGDSDTSAANSAANALLSQGVWEVDGVILTHYDADHAAGVPYLLQRVSTKALYLPDCADEDGTSDQLPRDSEQILVDEILQITYGSTKITLIPSLQENSDNESGLCVLFQTENCAILITGDRSTSGEWELMRTIDLPKLDVLIVGHHGSKYSTSAELLELTQPDVAIISVGESNTYGHPTQQTLDRLLAAGCVIYRTDLQGKIIFRG